MAAARGVLLKYIPFSVFVSSGVLVTLPNTAGTRQQQRKATRWATPGCTVLLDRLRTLVFRALRVLPWALVVLCVWSCCAVPPYSRPRAILRWSLCHNAAGFGPPCTRLWATSRWAWCHHAAGFGPPFVGPRAIMWWSLCHLAAGFVISGCVAAHYSYDVAILPSLHMLILATTYLVTDMHASLQRDTDGLAPATPGSTRPLPCRSERFSLM